MISGALVSGERLLCNGNVCRLERYQPSVRVTVLCEVCGLAFEVGKRKRYCSPDCSVEANRQRALRKAELVRASRPETKVKICGWCGDGVEVSSSSLASKLYHDACRAEATRHRNRKKTVKRQGAKTVERIDIFVLAERDNFVCHICSGLVDMSVSRVSRFGATVDHVVPISKGGLDSLENVRLAHWICNIRKSDSLEFVNG
jgi:5-methylcytosine-specific restriction endonuclease McrA